MSTNPTSRMADRRRFITERVAQLKSELDALAAEANEIDTAERVLKRFSEPPTVGGPIEIATPPSNGAVPEGDEMTLPAMVMILLEEARAKGRKGLTGTEILTEIKARWRPLFTADKVRPTLWRMAGPKDGRIKKRVKTYSLPPSSPEGETGALGAPVHH